MRRATETLELLRVLARHDVDFIVVGMTADVLQGAPSHLESRGHKLQETTFGDLDVLATTDDDLSYDALVPDTVSLTVAELSLRVLSLVRLIAVKERAGRPKDLAVLPLLRSTLELSRRT